MTTTASSTATRMTLADLEQSTDELPLLGYTVFWSLAGIRVKHDVLKDALAATGLASFTPDLPTPYMSIKRAIEHWIAQRAAAALGAGEQVREAEDADEGEDGGGTSGSRRQQRVLVRAIHDQDWLVFALVREAIADLGLSHVTTLRVLYNKKNKTIFCSTDPSGLPASGDGFEAVLKRDQQLTQELLQHWNRFRDLHVAGDLTDMMVEMLHSFQAVSLRPKKGTTYFVPQAHHDGLARMRQLLGILPTNGVNQPFLCALGALDRLEAKRQLANAVHESLMAEVDALSVDLERFTSAKAGTVKKKTMQERLAAYAALRQKIEIYADLMEMRKEDILGKLANLRKQAKEVMLGDGGAVEESEENEGSQMPLWNASTPMSGNQGAAPSEVA